MELKVVEFSEAHIPRVQHFECGSSTSAELAAQWIKARQSSFGALRSMRDHGNEVWLYFLLTSDDLVGFSSLGTTRWRIPPPDGPRREAGFVPMLAVASRFQGKRVAPRGKRYSWLILGNTLEKARERGFREVCLFAHIENTPAIRLYERHGFEVIGGKDERGLIRMLKLLD